MEELNGIVSYINIDLVYDICIRGECDRVPYHVDSISRESPVDILTTRSSQFVIQS